MSGFRGMSTREDVVPAGSRFGSSTGSLKNLPPGAVLLTRSQMLHIMTSSAKKWVPEREMFPITYGNGILSAVVALSGSAVNSHFRKCFKIVGKNPMISFAPTVVIPAVSVFMAHLALVQQPLLLGELSCPTCAEMRGTSLQVTCGILQPLALGFFSAAVIAKNNYTMVIPALIDIKGVAAMFTKFLKPVFPHMLVLAGINVIASGYIIFRQGQCTQLLHQKIFPKPNPEKLIDPLE